MGGVSKIADSVAKAEVMEVALEKKKPNESVRALEMLADGKGYRAIRRDTGLSFEGIAALKARHGLVLEERRRELAQDGYELMEKYRQLLNAKLDEMANDEGLLAKAQVKDLIMGYAIAQDKAMQAEDGNKVVVEHVKSGPSLEDAKKLIEEAQRQVRGEAIDV